MKSRKWLLVAALLLSAALATTGTLAYLTDTDSDVNVMTLGNVQIEQLEYQRVVDENGKWVAATEEDKYGYTPDMLEEYENKKPLYPAYFADGVIKYDDRVAGHQQSWGQIDAPGSCYLFDDSIVGAQDKFVFVKNTGSSDAYVRTWIALEQGSVDADKFADIIMTNSDEVHWSKKTVACDVEIGGNEYAVLCYTYLGPKSDPTGILAAGATSYPSLLQVYMKPEATNDDVQAIDGNKNGMYDILVFSQAVQTNNMPNAEAALKAAFGEATVANIPWKEANNAVEMMDILKGEGGTILAQKETEMLIETDKEIELDAKGATVVMNGTGTAPGESYDYGYLGFVPPAGQDVTISNLTVTGAGFVEMGHHGASTKGTYEANNLVVKDMVATLNINNGGNNIAAAFSHYGTATLNDCVMTGTTTLKDGYKPYDAAFVNGTETEINGGEYGYIYLANQAHVTIKDAKVGAIDTYAIAYKNLGKLTIGAGAEVGKIYVDAPSPYDPALVIEKGATVGEIIYEGVSYTAAQWMAANP